MLFFKKISSILCLSLTFGNTNRSWKNTFKNLYRLTLKGYLFEIEHKLVLTNQV